MPTWSFRTLSILLYFVLTCWMYGVDFFNNAKIIGGAGADMVQEVWFLAWPAYAMRTGHSIFFTTYMNNPHGINMMANTSMPLLGVVGAPITWIFGPVVTYTLFMRLGFILSAASAQFVARRIGLSRPASIAAGLLYGFSTIQIVQGNGHMFLVFAPVPPLILYSVYCLAIGRWKPVRAGVTVGLLMAVDFLISAERSLITMMVLGVLLVVAVPFCWRKINRTVIVNFLVAGACAGAVALVLLAVPIYEMTGRGHVSGVAHPWIQSYSSDLAAFIFPGRFTFFDPFNMKANILAASSQWENGSYIGIPLLLALVVATVRGWRNKLVLIGAVTTLIVIGMSLGEVLRVDGHVTSHKLPYKALTYVKYVQNIEPIRLMYLAWLGVALLGGFALDRLLRWRRSRPAHGSSSLSLWRTVAAGVVVVVVVVSLVPDHPYKMAPTGVSAWLQSPAAQREIPRNSVVLYYPYPTLLDNHAMLNQAVTGFPYQLIGGEGLAGNNAGVNVGIVPLSPVDLPTVFIRSFMGLPTGSVTPLTFKLPDLPAIDAATITEFRQFVTQNHVSTIVMENATSPSSVAVVPYLTAAFGPPTSHDGGSLNVWTHQQLHPAAN